MILLEKAKENFEIAEKSAEKEYYDVAISRLYYSMFQNLKNCLQNFEGVDYTKSSNSHEDTIKILEQYLLRTKKEDPKVLVKLMADFRGFKRKRQKADYEARKSTEQQYKKSKECHDFLTGRFEVYSRGVGKNG